MERFGVGDRRHQLAPVHDLSGINPNLSGMFFGIRSVYRV